MSPEEIDKLNNQFSHIAITKRIKDLETAVQERDDQICDLCIEVSGKRMDKINAADKKHSDEVFFDLIACLLIFAILIAAAYGGSALWCTLIGSSFYTGYLAARKRHGL